VWSLRAADRVDGAGVPGSSPGGGDLQAARGGASSPGRSAVGDRPIGCASGCPAANASTASPRKSPAPAYRTPAGPTRSPQPQPPSNLRCCCPLGGSRVVLGCAGLDGDRLRSLNSACRFGGCPNIASYDLEPVPARAPTRGDQRRANSWASARPACSAAPSCSAHNGRPVSDRHCSSAPSGAASGSGLGPEREAAGHPSGTCAEGTSRSPRSGHPLRTEQQDGRQGAEPLAAKRVSAVWRLRRQASRQRPRRQPRRVSYRRTIDRWNKGRRDRRPCCCAPLRGCTVVAYDTCSRNRYANCVPPCGVLRYEAAGGGLRGYGAAGSASAWHAEGQGFESP
jgi:hypothetical protein